MWWTVESHDGSRQPIRAPNLETAWEQANLLGIEDIADIFPEEPPEICWD